MMSRDDMRWEEGQRLEKGKRVPSPARGEGNKKAKMGLPRLLSFDSAQDRRSLAMTGEGGA